MVGALAAQAILVLLFVILQRLNNVWRRRRTAARLVADILDCIGRVEKTTDDAASDAYRESLIRARILVNTIQAHAERSLLSHYLHRDEEEALLADGAQLHARLVAEANLLLVERRVVDRLQTMREAIQRDCADVRESVGRLHARLDQIGDHQQQQYPADDNARSGTANTSPASTTVSLPPSPDGHGPAHHTTEPENDTHSLDGQRATTTATSMQWEGLERERDFYFKKLRDIEILVQEQLEPAEPSGKDLDVDGDPILREIQGILYATEEGFEPPEEGTSSAE